MWQDEVDIVFAPKGGGKSAIYSMLVSREGELFDRGIVLVAGENPEADDLGVALDLRRHPRVHRPPLGRNGRVARTGLRHAASPRECIAVRYGIWRPAMEYAEVMGAPFRAVPRRARWGTGHADDRQGPATIWYSPTYVVVC